MAGAYRILLFDIDGLRVSSGAVTVAWRRSFEELHGIPADIGEYTDAGMTDRDCHLPGLITGNGDGAAHIMRQRGGSTGQHDAAALREADADHFVTVEEELPLR